ncbi:MAG: hypothetical protein EXR62_15330 [Chloroflexi bacterium]|nr:hypothetical protein [Chloroflexota bacterium]
MTLNNARAGATNTGGRREQNQDGGANRSSYAYDTAKPGAGQVVYTSRGQVGGQVVGDTLHKRVQGSEHQLKRPPAWCVDVAILAEAGRLGASKVKILDTETETTYQAAIGDFFRQGVEIDRGFGLQRALPLAYFETYKRGQLRPTQLTLF